MFNNPFPNSEISIVYFELYAKTQRKTAKFERLKSTSRTQNRRFLTQQLFALTTFSTKAMMSSTITTMAANNDAGCTFKPIQVRCLRLSIWSVFPLESKFHQIHEF